MSTRVIIDRPLHDLIGAGSGGAFPYRFIDHEDDDTVCDCGDADRDHDYDGGAPEIASAADEPQGSPLPASDPKFDLQLLDHLVFADPAIQQAIEDGEA
jgi:hypothetical protein